MTYSKTLYSMFVKNYRPVVFILPLGGAYIGKMFDDAETERMSKYRDRSGIYGRPPPPPGVKEIPSW